MCSSKLIQQRSPGPGPRGGYGDAPATIEKKDLGSPMAGALSKQFVPGAPLGNERQDA